jgi:hypothetical protein
VDYADLDQYRPYVDSQPDLIEWQYGNENGVWEFAPDLIAYAVTDPSVIAAQIARDGKWDPAEIDRLVGEAVGQPDFRKVRDAVADRDVGTKAALSLLPDIEVDQREGESYKAAVRRTMRDEVGGRSNITAITTASSDIICFGNPKFYGIAERGPMEVKKMQLNEYSTTYAFSQRIDGKPLTSSAFVVMQSASGA